MNVLEFIKRKQSAKPITMVTAYDYFSARTVQSAGVDCILVGDSAGMVIHGDKDTLQMDPEIMTLHTRAVRKGAPDTFIVSDMPFLSHRKGLDFAVETAGELIRAGANAVKLEGARGVLDLVKHLVESGIPVMGHLGLTPQSIHQLGGYKVQGRSNSQQQALRTQALELQSQGCFSLVLECVPAELALEVSAELTIPVIGIGCGNGTDGQVLVWHDLLGCFSDFKPKFVRRFANLSDVAVEGLRLFVSEVKEGTFPSQEESYK
jgi:3-methyl-2-oxobutanoate hydroxymethyltransferase